MGRSPSRPSPSCHATTRPWQRFQRPRRLSVRLPLLTNENDATEPLPYCGFRDEQPSEEACERRSPADARLTCAADHTRRLYERSSSRLIERIAAPRRGSRRRDRDTLAGMRRTSLLLAPLVVTVALSGVALAASPSARSAACTVTPKQGWTSCPHGNLAGRDLVRADLRNATLHGTNLTGAKLTLANL